MDHPHTLIRMRDGDLELAVPTKTFNNLIRQAENQVTLDVDICGQISSSQHQTRVDELVWNHICEQRLQDAELHMN